MVCHGILSCLCFGIMLNICNSCIVMYIIIKTCHFPMARPELILAPAPVILQGCLHRQAVTTTYTFLMVCLSFNHGLHLFWSHLCSYLLGFAASYLLKIITCFIMFIIIKCHFFIIQFKMCAYKMWHEAICICVLLFIYACACVHVCVGVCVQSWDIKFVYCLLYTAFMECVFYEYLCVQRNLLCFDHQQELHKRKTSYKHQNFQMLSHFHMPLLSLPQESQK